VGTGAAKKSFPGVVREGTWGHGKETGLNFLAMIEVYVFGQLRDLGISSQKIRKCQAELSKRLGVSYPFASCKLLSRDGSIFMELEVDTLLELDASGQKAFSKILRQFCEKIEFDDESSQAAQFWPMGKDHNILVDPKHAFGQPRVKGTNILAETVSGMVLSGESPEKVAKLFEIPVSSVQDSVEFFSHQAA
jgi:uncharacterized protein (DUF433 family)